MKKVGATPYHICYECTDMESALDEWQQKGFLLVREPSSVPALENHRVAFLYNAAIGLIELLEEGSEIYE